MNEKSMAHSTQKLVHRPYPSTKIDLDSRKPRPHVHAQSPRSNRPVLGEGRMPLARISGPSSCTPSDHVGSWQAVRLFSPPSNFTSAAPVSPLCSERLQTSPIRQLQGGTL